MNKIFTELEEKVIKALVTTSECQDFETYLINSDNYDQFANVEELSYSTGLNEHQIGALLTSLEKKAVVMIAEAEEYSLGCNCFYIWNTEKVAYLFESK